MELSLTLKNMKNRDASAFPVIDSFDNGSIGGIGVDSSTGLTKREYFVAIAMQSIIQLKGASTFEMARNNEGVCNDIAEASIRVADELLKQIES